MVVELRFAFSPDRIPRVEVLRVVKHEKGGQHWRSAEKQEEQKGSEIDACRDVEEEHYKQHDSEDQLRDREGAHNCCTDPFHEMELLKIDQTECFRGCSAEGFWSR
jgi:hypothetical protein